MTRRSCLLRSALLGAYFSVFLSLVGQNTAISADPEPDKANSAAMQSFQFDSHGSLLNAFVYIAAGASPRSTVILLHGFPGNERTSILLSRSVAPGGMFSTLTIVAPGALLETSRSFTAWKLPNPPSPTCMPKRMLPDFALMRNRCACWSKHGRFQGS